MRFTFDSVAVHFRECCGPLSLKKGSKKDNKNFCKKVYVRQKEIMKFTWLSAAVLFSVWSSAFFCPMKYARRFWSREKQSVLFSVNLKLLLNRKELERVFYMKKLRLVDIFPMAYHLNHFDNRFVKNLRQTATATRRPLHDFQN